MELQILRFAISLMLTAILTSGREMTDTEKRQKKFVPTFKIEYGWLSDHAGGYVGHFKVPVFTEIPSWTMALLFPERVYNITAWQATLTEITPDGLVVYLKQTQWNGHQYPGMVLDQRFLVQFNRTAGIDYNGYTGPKPDIVFLEQVFIPDRHIDYEHDMKIVNYSFYSKPVSKYFRRLKMKTVPVTTTTTISTTTTTTEFDPFKYSGQEVDDGSKWWFVSTSKRPDYLTGTTAPTASTASLTTTLPLLWWKLVHSKLTTTLPPKPTPVAADCSKAVIEKTRHCKKKRKPIKRCHLPQCAADNIRFKAVQCWKRLGHCWCVEPRSGVKIGSTVVKFRNAYKLNCFAGDKSRTEPQTTTTPLPFTASTTPVYIPEGLGGISSEKRPIFAPRNTYDYPKILHNSHLFFEAQRSGDIGRNGRISWRRSAHLKDGSECGKDLSGGYYYGGSYVKFGFPTAFSTTLMAWSFLEAKDAYQAAWQTKFLKDTLKWATDYFLKAHVSQNEFYGQVGDPIYEYKNWTRPQDMDGISRPCYSITNRSPGSDLAAETAAALAATAQVWIKTGSKKDDPYVKLLLKHAKELFQFADKYRGQYSNSIRAAANHYFSTGYGDELTWAALWLYTVTGEGQYLANAQRKFNEFQLFKHETEFSWDRKGAGVQLLLSRITGKRHYIKPLLEFCDYVLPGVQTTYTLQGLLFTSDWGPTRYACNAAFICQVASKLRGVDDDRKLKYRKFAENQVDYILGKTGKSFVIGFGKNYPTQPHHRASSCSLAGKCSFEDFHSTAANPQVLVGAMVGGPDQNDYWMNDRSNAKTNSVALDYNAGLQAAVAVLRQFQLEYKAWYDSLWRQKTR